MEAPLVGNDPVSAGPGRGELWGRNTQRPQEEAGRSELYHTAP